MAQKIWGGRFKEDTDALAQRFNASIGFDYRLYAQDIDGSLAHCQMLAKQGIISDEEASRIQKALEEIRKALERDEIPIEDDTEDIHGLVERALVDKIGEVGEKLHTGRIPVIVIRTKETQYFDFSEADITLNSHAEFLEMTRHISLE